MRWLVLALCGCGSSQTPQEPSRQTSPTPLVARAGDDVEGAVGQPIRFDGTGSSGDSFLWDFGDGTTAEGLVVEHTYAASGNYTAVLQASSSDGSFRTDSLLAVAYNPPGTSTRSASMLALDGTGTPWVVVPEAGTANRVTGVGSSVVSVCDEPRSIAARAGELMVACGEDRLVTLDEVGDLVQTLDLPAGSHPRKVLGDDSGWLITLSGTGSVLATDGMVEYALEDANGLASAGGLFFASRYRSTDGVGQIGGTGPLTLDFDPGPDSDTTIRGVPTALENLALSSDGGWLYSGGVLANTARGPFLDGQQTTFETSVRAFVEASDPASGSRRWRKQFDDHGMTGPLALSERGNWLFVGFPTTRDVLILDAYSGDIVSSILDTGLGIRGLQVDGDTLYVYAWLDRMVYAWDLSNLGTPTLSWSAPVTDDEPLDPQVLLGKQVFWDAADTRMAKAGYLSCAVCHPDGEHDGQTWDFTGRGEGLRNTTSLLGRGGVGMGPVHWTATFDEIQDFEHDIRESFGGSGFLPPSVWEGAAGTPLGSPKAGHSVELDALAAYVSSLTETPTSPHPNDTTGQDLFTSAGCDGCHPAPLFTDSPSGLRHDIGTADDGSGQRLGLPLDGFDTPTLLGAWQTGPWLHDGSAATLGDAIGAHESAAALTTEEIDALAAYVRSL